jgi:hypothetical protein
MPKPDPGTHLMKNQWIAGSNPAMTKKVKG